jgi:oligopeptide transport system substrate-binding protein
LSTVLSNHGVSTDPRSQNDPDKAKVLSNPNFRKAISYALDRETFVEKVMGGNGIPATVQTPPGHTIYPGKTWGEATPNIGKYHPETADLAQSKEYMDKALAETGFASVADLPEFELLTSEDPQNPKMVTPYVLSILTQELGLKVRLKQVTGPDFWNVLLEPALGFDMAVTGWGPDYDDPFTYMGYWVSSSKDMGVTFDNPDYDATLDRANAETDLVRRAEIRRGRGALRRYRPLGALRFLRGRGRGAALGEGPPVLGLRRQRQLRLR